MITVAGELDNIDPRAVVWRIMHADLKPCQKCPTCALLPCMSMYVCAVCTVYVRLTYVNIHI